MSTLLLSLLRKKNTHFRTSDAMLTIQNLQHTPLATIVKAFGSAFADYAVDFNESEVYSILKRRGFDASSSYAAFDDNEIVGFTLNGIGRVDGLLSAYDTGTGVVKDYRGQGLSARIFTHSLPYLKAQGIEQYVLEVLQNNEPAIKVYQDLGFGVHRTLRCYRQEKPEALRSFSLCTVERCPLSALLPAAAFQDFAPSWQNSFDSLQRAGEDLICLAAKLQEEIVGYCVFDPLTGDLSNIAVSPDYRRRGIGSRLLNEMYPLLQTDAVKCLNIAEGGEELCAFLEKCGYELLCQQYEMVRKV